MDSLRRLIWMTIIIGIISNKGYCKPSSELDKDKDSYDYINDDNYQNDDEDSNDEGEYKGPPPHITTKSVTLTVKEGDDVLIPCEVRNGDPFTKIWKNGSNVLFLDNSKMSKDHRLTKFENNTLHIRYALIYDSGNYSCQVAAKPLQEVVHIVNVVNPPVIVRVLPQVPAGQSKVIRKGDSLTLACEVRGYPTPIVTWTRRNHKHFPNGHEKMEGSSITFEEVNRKYSGVYECEATNAHGTKKESVEIHVHYPPEIEIEEETVTTALGYEPEITCTVHAEPKATVSWYKNGQPVARNNRISMTVVNNKHTLQITNMNQEDFGSYTCRAANELGSVHKAITLSGSPTKPKVKIGVSNDGKSPEITWTVESYSPISEYELEYKRMDDERWTRVKPAIYDPTEGNIYSGKETLRDLSPVEYHVRVRARNSHGWSASSQEEPFSGEAAAESKTGGSEYLRPAAFLQLLIMYTISKIFI